MKSFLLLLITFTIAKCSFAQDTTGGTRANIIIPLHKSPVKSNVPAGAPGIAYDSTQPLNTTDRKLRNAAAAKKYRRKASVKKATITPSF